MTLSESVLSCSISVAELARLAGVPTRLINQICDYPDAESILPKKLSDKIRDIALRNKFSYGADTFLNYRADALSNDRDEIVDYMTKNGSCHIQQLIDNMSFAAGLEHADQAMTLRIGQMIRDGVVLKVGRIKTDYKGVVRRRTFYVLAG